MNEQDQLDVVLARLGAEARIITYANLSAELGLAGAGQIARLACTPRAVFSLSAR